jgi:hypothetical protein
MASVLPNMSANYRVRLPLNNHWYELARGTLSGKGNPLRTGRGIRHGRGDQNLVLGPRTPMAGIGSASRNVGSRAPGMLNREFARVRNRLWRASQNDSAAGVAVAAISHDYSKEKAPQSGERRSFERRHWGFRGMGDVAVWR